MRDCRTQKVLKTLGLGHSSTLQVRPRYIARVAVGIGSLRLSYASFRGSYWSKEGENKNGGFMPDPWIQT